MNNKLSRCLFIVCFMALISSCKKEDVAPDLRYIYYNESGADVGIVVCDYDGKTEDSMVIKNLTSLMIVRRFGDSPVKIYYNDRLAEIYRGNNLLAQPRDPRNYDNYEIVDTNSRLFYYFYTFTNSDYQNFLDRK